MRRLLRFLEDLVWPRRVKCLCCDEYSEGEWLCEDCGKALRAMMLRPEEAGEADTCSVYRYDGVAKQLVLLLKEENLADAACALAAGMAEIVRRMQLPPDALLTWVTMPEIRRMKRGIDHGRRLCEAVAEETGLPVRQLLHRSRNVRTQRGLNRAARLKNLTGAFVCREKISGTVLLIDDVMTTGATASVCASVLREAGASRVYVLTATRAVLNISDE